MKNKCYELWKNRHVRRQERAEEHLSKLEEINCEDREFVLLWLKLVVCFYLEFYSITKCQKILDYFVAQETRIVPEECTGKLLEKVLGNRDSFREYLISNSIIYIRRKVEEDSAKIPKSLHDLFHEYEKEYTFD